ASACRARSPGKAAVPQAGSEARAALVGTVELAPRDGCRWQGKRARPPTLISGSRASRLGRAPLALAFGLAALVGQPPLARGCRRTRGAAALRRRERSLQALPKARQRELAVACL